MRLLHFGIQTGQKVSVISITVFDCVSPTASAFDAVSPQETALGHS